MSDLASKLTVPVADEIHSSQDEMDTAGKNQEQLLTDDAEILTQIELLKQESHSFKVAYARQSKTMAIQEEELEKQEKENNKLTEELCVTQKKIEEMKKKNKILLQDNHQLKVMYDEKEDQAKKYLCEAENDKNRHMKELQQKLADVLIELEVLRNQKEQLLEVVEGLKAVVDDRDNEIKNIQEKNEELKKEIIKEKHVVETPNNMKASIFAELNPLNTNNEKFLHQEQDSNKPELYDARADVTTLESDVSEQNNDDEEKNLMKASETSSILNEDLKNVESDYLRVILKSSQLREKVLLEESNTYNSKISDLEKQLHRTRANLQNLKEDLRRVVKKSEKMDPDFQTNCDRDAEINEMTASNFPVRDDNNKEEPHQRIGMKIRFQKALWTCFKCTSFACICPRC